MQYGTVMQVYTKYFINIFWENLNTKFIDFIFQYSILKYLDVITTSHVSFSVSGDHSNIKTANLSTLEEQEGSS